MGKDLRLFLTAVGLPALVIAGAGIWLIRCEVVRARALQEERMRSAESRRKEFLEKRDHARRERHGSDWARGRHSRLESEVGAVEGSSESSAAEPYCRPPCRPRMPMFSPMLFSPEESVATERILWIGSCMVGLLILSFAAGGGLLVRAARRAREESIKKTDFLSNVSHEFKTPLTTICLCAELAQDDGLSPERRKKALSSILSEANRLKGLVLNALDFSRLEKSRRVFSIGSCNLVELLNAAAGPLAARFEPGGLVLPDPESSVMANVDSGAFQQIVVILLDNAAKYAAAGGPVEVSFAPARAGRVRICVSDRGPGLDRNGLRHAFDRFWRGDDATTAETGGSGLGLAIARGLARGMGGDLAVAPRPGGGLVFTLELKS